jgi:hypothetical protein
MAADKPIVLKVYDCVMMIAGIYSHADLCRRINIHAQKITLSINKSLMVKQYSPESVENQ